MRTVIGQLHYVLRKLAKSPVFTAPDGSYCLFAVARTRQGCSFFLALLGIGGSFSRGSKSH